MQLRLSSSSCDFLPRLFLRFSCWSFFFVPVLMTRPQNGIVLPWYSIAVYIALSPVIMSIHNQTQIRIGNLIPQLSSGHLGGDWFRIRSWVKNWTECKLHWEFNNTTLLLSGWSATVRNEYISGSVCVHHHRNHSTQTRPSTASQRM